MSRLILADELRKAKGLSPKQPRREFENRVKRFRELMDRRGFNAVLVYGTPKVPSWIRYLANYIHPFPFSESFLMLPIEGDPILIVDFPWFMDHAREMSWIEDVRIFPNYQYDKLVRFFRDIFTKKGLETAKIGICTTHMPTIHYMALKQGVPEATFEDDMGLLIDLMATKSRYDCEMIRKTARIADEGMRAMLNTCEEGKREYEVGLAAEAVMCAKGAEYGSGITARTWQNVGSSNYSRLGNTRPYVYTARKLKRGDMFYVDLGVCYKGYYIDFCRTVSIGEPTEKQKEIFEIVSDTHEKLFRSLRPDITGSELWEIGYNIAEKAGYAEHINIWFGHGIGIEVIEPPFLDKGDMRTLKQGTFVNIEPGIFLPGIGGAAIEDTTFITKRGVEFVTKCNRELHVAR